MCHKINQLRMSSKLNSERVKWEDFTKMVELCCFGCLEVRGLNKYVDFFVSLVWGGK